MGIDYKNFLYRTLANLILIKELGHHAEKRQGRKIVKGTNNIRSNGVFKNEILNRIQGLYLKTYEVPIFFDLFIALIGQIEYYGFEKYSSVGKKYDINTNINQNQYDLLSRVNLFTHTINCFCLSLEQSTNIPSETREEITILALAHDYGKCPMIFKEFARNTKDPHNYVSAEFLRSVCIDLEIDMSVRDRMVDVIRKHHNTGDDQDNNSFFIQQLNEIDIEARKSELEKIYQGERVLGGKS